MAGADEQATALADRFVLGDPGDVAELLDGLWVEGAQDQVAALLARDPAAHVALDNPADVAGLLDSMREAGADEQATALADRFPGAGMFELFREKRDLQDQFWFGREADGSPAKPWD